MIKIIFMYKLLTVLALTLSCLPSFAQKVLQLEKIGKIETTKIYLGETFFLRTIHHPDYWLKVTLDDVLIEAAAIVLSDRIIPIEEITTIRWRKKSKMSELGRAVQYSAIAPVGYELIYGLVEPPIQWQSLSIYAGGTFLIGSLMKLIPPKKYKMGKKYRLRVLDLTF